MVVTMLVKYPTAALVVEADVKGLSAIKGISIEKAQAIIKKAKNNTQDVNQQIAHIITVTSKEILHKEELVKEEKIYLTSMYKDSEDVILLDGIPGIGPDSAVSIALEIEDITRFESAKKLAAFFGTHPTFKQSGDGMWGNHMSKKRRGEIRAILYMTSLTAIRHNPILKQVYARSRSKGSMLEFRGFIMVPSTSGSINLHEIFPPFISSFMGLSQLLYFFVYFNSIGNLADAREYFCCRIRYRQSNYTFLQVG